MRNPTYLTRSRHGIYHLRWRLWGATDTQKKPTYLKVSLCTRDPREALKLAQMLSAGAVSLGYGPGCRMRYDELRTVLQTHFAEMLKRHKEQVARSGPMDHNRVQALQNAASFAQAAVLTGEPVFVTAAADKDVLRRLIAKYNLDIEVGSEAYDQLLKIFPIAYRDYAQSALRHNEECNRFDYEDYSGRQATELLGRNKGISLRELINTYFAETEKGSLWASKTRHEKADHVSLLKEFVDEDADVSAVTVQVAQKVKATLLRYPRNRNKNPATRNLSLDEALDLAGIETINAQTINKYLQTYGALFGWALKNGHVSKNVFAGMNIKSTKRAAVERQPFSATEIKSIYDAVVSNECGKTRLSYQKWGTLIGLYTGARLGEIAQIHLKDIIYDGELWYFDLNDDDEGKHLKNESSKRAVPMHPRLIELGLLGYKRELESQGQTKLFPTFTYCPKNGWGRALGRWFNDKFLHELGIKNRELVFHSLRHTVTNSLQRADVPHTVVQALIGHTRADMLGQHYSASGF